MYFLYLSQNTQSKPHSILQYHYIKYKSQIFEAFFDRFISLRAIEKDTFSS